MEALKRRDRRAQAANEAAAGDAEDESEVTAEALPEVPEASADAEKAE